MKKIALLFAIPLLLAACNRDPYQVENPDPNHIHADFAVWVGLMKIDFSEDQFMSGLSTDDATHDEEGEYLHQHLHLHDNIGNVIHSHKPGLTLGEFMASIGYVMHPDACLQLPDDSEQCFMQMIVNGENIPFDPAYLLVDLDQILLTDAATPELSAPQWEKLTDDACLYSKRCPWRGDPPAENCVADPAVPCVAPLD